MTQRENEEQEAQRYAELINGPFRGDWAEINAQLIDRYSLTAFKRIKTRAWRLVDEKKEAIA